MNFASNLCAFTCNLPENVKGLVMAQSTVLPSGLAKCHLDDTKDKVKAKEPKCSCSGNHDPDKTFDNPDQVEAWKLPAGNRFKPFGVHGKTAPKMPDGQEICIKYQVLGSCFFAKGCPHFHSKLSGETFAKFDKWCKEILTKE